MTPNPMGDNSVGTFIEKSQMLIYFTSHTRERVLPQLAFQSHQFYTEIMKERIDCQYEIFDVSIKKD